MSALILPRIPVAALSNYENAESSSVRRWVVGAVGCSKYPLEATKLFMVIRRKE